MLLWCKKYKYIRIRRQYGVINKTTVTFTCMTVMVQHCKSIGCMIITYPISNRVKSSFNLSFISKHDKLDIIKRRLTMYSLEFISCDIKFSRDNFRLSSIFVSVLERNMSLIEELLGQSSKIGNQNWEMGIKPSRLWEVRAVSYTMRQPSSLLFLKNRYQ